MPRRKLLVPAAVLLVFAASPWGHPVASAGWGPVVGGGSYFDTNSSGGLTYFTANNGSFFITYYPDNLEASSIYVSTGSPGYRADADRFFSVSNGGTTFSAYYGNGGTVTLSFTGNPGPLNSDGDPLSLDDLEHSGGIVLVEPSYNVDELFFSGQFASVPEPSSLLTITLGIGGVGLAICYRRRKKRPGPRGLTGR